MSSVAVERALILLRYIVNHKDDLSIREASRDLGDSPAKAQNTINAMRDLRFVVQDNQTDDKMRRAGCTGVDPRGLRSSTGDWHTSLFFSTRISR